MRLTKLRSKLNGLEADAILVSSSFNIRYLCGFSGSSGILVVQPEAATLFTDSRYTFQAAQEVAGARVSIVKVGLSTSVGGFLRGKKSLRRIAYSESNITVAQKVALQKAAGSRLRWTSDLNAIEALRSVKDEEELNMIREAAVLISDVFSDVLKEIRPGVTEIELAAELDYRMKRMGASGPSFETIAASGARTAWPHARPSSKPLAKNELVLLDQGAILRGYCSDMTRTVFLGAATSRVRKLYRAVLEAQQAAKNAIHPGVAAGDVDRAARRVLTRAGLGRYFMHSTGHGLGLEVHEMPRLGKGVDAKLQAGMVVTIEPGVYLEGFGGIRIEDDVVVTRRGYDDLTTAPRELLEL